MTFPTFKFKVQSQAGVSLMLGILILSAIMAIALSLATIVFVEIKSSTDNLRTEPTAYAALGFTEEALFQYKRFYTGNEFDVSTCAGPENNGDSTCNLNGVELSNTAPLDFDVSPRVEYVPFSNTKTIALYQASSFEKLYTQMTLETLPNGGDLDYYLLRTDSETGQTVCDNTGRAPDPTCEPTRITGTVIYNNFLSNTQYDLVLMNQSSTDASVSIATSYHGEPRGLPFVGEAVFRVKAGYKNLTRTYQVNIPIP